MEIRFRPAKSGPILAALFALIVLGIGSLFLTWQSIKYQHRAVEDHMVLSGDVIVRGVEANLIRYLRSLRNNPALSQMFPTLAQEFFQEVADSDEVAFLALYNSNGQLLIGSKHDHEELEAKLPQSAYHELMQRGHWHSMSTFDSKQVLVVGVTARPGMARVYARIDPSRKFMGRQGPGMGWGKGAQPNAMRQQEPPIFFVAGINAEHHLIQFSLYRRAAMLQTGYVFGAAVLLWLLTFAYLKRRDQDKRVGQLERFQSKLLDNMPDGLVTLGPDGEIMAANPSARRLLDPQGSKQGCLTIGCNWSDFPFANPNDNLEWKQYEYHGRHLEILSVPFQDHHTATNERSESDNPLEEGLILIRDRTAIRSLEDDLEESKRLASIGSLAAGVAHEIRNPLSSLRGFAQFFADKFKTQKPYADYATTMVKEADRLNRVVTDLLYLARPHEIVVAKITLSETIESLQKLMRFDLEHKQVVPKIDLAVSTLNADPDGLTQVLLNLISNGLDALPEQGGRLRISSRQDSNGVCLSVEDNGPGIPDKDHQQALEPFYTTKKKGTGLGLAIVNTILRAHRGRTVISNSALGGTCVELFFPNKADNISSKNKNSTEPGR